MKKIIPGEDSNVQASIEPPRVFVSYAHGADDHNERVLQLVERLRREGVDATVDRYAAAEAGWPQWMAEQIEAADFVLLICDEAYRLRFESRADARNGKGVRWEAMLIQQELYEAGATNAKFFPVVFTQAETQFIPAPLRSFTQYVLDSEDGYLRLYRRLTNQPEIVPAALGDLVSLPAREVQPFSAASPAVQPLRGRPPIQWEPRLLSLDYINLARLAQLMADMGDPIDPPPADGSYINSLGLRLPALMFAVQKILKAMRPPAVPLETVREWRGMQGALLAISNVRFRTKNIPGLDYFVHVLHGRYRYKGSLAEDPHVYCSLGDWRLVLPIDPRWLTTDSAFGHFREAGGQRYVSGLVVVREIDERRKWVVASPIVLGLPRHEFHDQLFGTSS